MCMGMLIWPNTGTCVCSLRQTARARAPDRSNKAHTLSTPFDAFRPHLEPFLVKVQSRVQPLSSISALLNPWQHLSTLLNPWQHLSTLLNPLATPFRPAQPFGLPFNLRSARPHFSCTFTHLEPPLEPFICPLGALLDPLEPFCPFRDPD